jgi:dTDP-4-dehydrorhamnose reductase
LLGKNGQVGWELQRALQPLGEVIALDRQTSPEGWCGDVTNFAEISKAFEQIRPDIVVNASAYTAVDKAESDAEQAHLINCLAVKHLAEECQKHSALLIHYSTDYVFDGLKKEAYVETDTTNPQSVYGKTKCEGEEKVRHHLKHIILRTSWVFGSHGNNFLKTILRLTTEKESLNIVSDQCGSPASASMLTDITFKIVDSIFKNKNFNDYGTYHVTNEGETNWHGYANLIAVEARKLGVKIKCETNHIRPIATSEYATAAKRPLNSRLNCEKIKKIFMLELPHWESEVKKVLREII